MLGDLSGEVGEHEIGARAFDGVEMLERDGRAVEPSVGRRRLDHRVLTRHVIGGDRHVELGAHARDDIEVRQRRLDHDDVRAFGDVEPHLFDRLSGIADVLLVSLAIAAIGDGDIDGIAERAVQRRGIFSAVGENDAVGEVSVVERRSDGGHLTIHHAGRCDDVGACRGLRDCDAPVEVERGVVVDTAFAVEDAAMAMVGVFVDAEIGAQHHRFAKVVA